MPITYGVILHISRSFHDVKPYPNKTNVNNDVSNDRPIEQRGGEPLKKGVNQE